MMRKLSLADLPAGQSCTYVHHNIGQQSPEGAHTHDFHELFWVDENTGTHWINDQALPLRRGDLVLIHASDFHALTAHNVAAPLRIVNFAFHAKVWGFLQQRYFGGAPIFFSNPSLAARCYQLDDFQLAAIRQAAGWLRSGLRDPVADETFC